MTDTDHLDARGTDRVLGSLLASDGSGTLRLEEHYATTVEDLWSALTDPERLGRWYAEITGELQVGAEHRERVFASGWEGVGVVEVCEPPHRLVVRSRLDGATAEDVTEVTLTPDGDGTRLVLVQRGLPVDQLPAYGAGTQVHAEDLAAHLAGRPRCDARTRWAELAPAYQALAIS